MAGARKRNKKIVRYRRPFNIGVVFFGFIAVYLLVCIYMYFSSEHISAYEVIEGNLATDYHYTGFALRTEQIYYASSAGYVNYYAAENEKVSVLSTVYTLDENGEMSQLLSDSAGEVSFSDEDYDTIRSDITAYLNTSSDMKFSEVYDFKTTVNGTILDLMNQNLLEQLDSTSETNSLFVRCAAETAGVVEYGIDGYEGATLENLSADWFDRENYSSKDLRENDLVSAGDMVYKLVTDENWKLIFPLDEEMESYINGKLEANQSTAEDGSISQGTTYIEIRFDRDDEIVWPSVTVQYVDGQAYGVLSFVNSMVRYADQRYLSFEVLRDEESGLKIPKSALTMKDFYVIPVDYLTTSGNDTGVLRQVTQEDGTAGAEFVNCTIYYQDEEYAYVDPNEESFSTSEKLLENGDLLVKQDSAEYYQIGQTSTLQGVYNINKGYTIFRHVEILFENEEYCIVKKGTSRGLSVYDRIVLNAETVTESQIVY